MRHLDHVDPVRSGGTTELANGQGLCARCNLTKELLGWRHRPDVTGTTVKGPTGHTWWSPTPAHRAAHPPEPPRVAGGRRRLRLDCSFAHRVAAA